MDCGTIDKKDPPSYYETRPCPGYRDKDGV